MYLLKFHFIVSNILLHAFHTHTKTSNTPQSFQYKNYRINNVALPYINSLKWFVVVVLNNENLLISKCIYAFYFFYYLNFVIYFQLMCYIIKFFFSFYFFQSRHKSKRSRSQKPYKHDSITSNSSFNERWRGMHRLH